MSLNASADQEALAQARAQIEALTIALIAERRLRRDLENETTSLRDYIVSQGWDLEQ